MSLRPCTERESNIPTIYSGVGDSVTMTGALTAEASRHSEAGIISQTIQELFRR